MPDSATVMQSPIVTSASIHSLTVWTKNNGLVSERNWFTFSHFMKMWFKGIGASYITDTSIMSVPTLKMDGPRQFHADPSPGYDGGRIPAACP